MRTPPILARAGRKQKEDGGAQPRDGPRDARHHQSHPHPVLPHPRPEREAAAAAYPATEQKARRKRRRKITRRGASISRNTEVMGTLTHPPKLSPILSATTIRNIRDGGRSGCAKNWGCTTRNMMIVANDGVGV